MKTRYAREIREQVVRAQADAAQQYDPDDQYIRPPSWIGSNKAYRQYVTYREAYRSATRRIFNQATPEAQARMTEEHRLRNLSPAERKIEALEARVNRLEHA